MSRYRITASNVGVAGVYNSAYPSGSGTFTFNLGSGNSGWSTTPTLTTFPSQATPGALTASPSSLSFGDQNVGSTSSAQAVTISNPGSSAQTISSVSASSQFSQANSCGSSLAAGASCTVSVKFSPTSGGSQTGTLTVQQQPDADPDGEPRRPGDHLDDQPGAGGHDVGERLDLGVPPVERQ